MKKLIIITLLATLLACNPKKQYNNTSNNKLQEESKDTLIIYKIIKVKENPYWNALAEFLAGYTSKDPLLYERQQSRFYNNYKHKINAMWNKRKKEFITPLQKWATTEMPKEHNSNKNVFYPFSGPDFLTIYTLFPNANNYLLLGLEPEGHLNNYLNFNKYIFWMNELNLITIALDDIMNYSFFKTKDMEKELKHRYLDGTTALIILFMKKFNLNILNVKRIYITPKLTIKTIKDETYPFTPWDTIITGIKIYFKNPKYDKVQTLIYLSHDASDNMLNKDSTLTMFIKKFFKNGANTYVKSASYLMYKPYFSKIKNTILNISDFYLQDDSGMPIYNFDTTKWNLKFYGTYTKPIPLFYNWFQKKLFEIYKNDTTIKPLPFGIGYYIYPNKSNLMIARKKYD